MRPSALCVIFLKSGQQTWGVKLLRCRILHLHRSIQGSVTHRTGTSDVFSVSLENNRLHKATNSTVTANSWHRFNCSLSGAFNYWSSQRTNTQWGRCWISGQWHHVWHQGHQKQWTLWVGKPLSFSCWNQHVAVFITVVRPWVGFWVFWVWLCRGRHTQHLYKARCEGTSQVCSRHWSALPWSTAEVPSGPYHWITLWNHRFTLDFIFLWDNLWDEIYRFF